MTKQELEQAIEKVRLSKQDQLHLANQIGSNRELYRHLWELVRKESDFSRFSRAVWVFELCSTQHPDLVYPILEEIIEFLPHPNHNGTYRSLVKILAHLDHIPEKYQGILYSLCIDWLLNPQKQVAIKVHCMSIAALIAKAEPDLQEELRLVITDQLDYNSSAFAARARKVLKKMKH